MKEQILEIADKLRNGEIDSDEAQNLLLCLFGVSESFSKSDLLDLGGWFDGSPEFVEEVVSDCLNAR